MRDTLERAENAISNFRHALEVENGHSAYAHLREIERNSVAWIPELATECEAYRKFAMTANTIAILGSLHQEEPLHLVYICSPCRGNLKSNIAAARNYCHEAMEEGYIPIAPHVVFADILDDDDPRQRALGIRMGLELLHFCRELWVFGPIISEGMRGEIEQAKTLKIPVRRIDG